MEVPNVAHIIWVNGRLSDVGWLAACMALDNGGFERVNIWSESPDALTIDRRIEYLLATGRVKLRHYGELCDSGLDAATRPGLTDKLKQLEKFVKLPSPRADNWRLRILWQEGGVYLDTDALCLRDMAPVRRSAPTFFGCEHIAVPSTQTVGLGSLNLWGWLTGGSLYLLRHILISMGVGASRRFQHVARFYRTAPNLAVIGSIPKAPALARLLTMVGDIPLTPPPWYDMLPEHLGPIWRLMQQNVGTKSAADLVVHPPTAFYPIGTELCIDYVLPDPDNILGNTPNPESYACHLYDSVLINRMGCRIDLEWLRAHRKNTLLGRMVNRWLDLVP